MNVYEVLTEVYLDGERTKRYVLTFEAETPEQARAEAIAYADRITGYRADGPHRFGTNTRCISA